MDPSVMPGKEHQPEPYSLDPPFGETVQSWDSGHPCPMLESCSSSRTSPGTSSCPTGHEQIGEWNVNGRVGVCSTLTKSARPAKLDLLVMEPPLPMEIFLVTWMSSQTWIPSTYLWHSIRGPSAALGLVAKPEQNHSCYPLT